MELAAIHSPATAFVAGLVTSLHCAGMCGPLSCSLLPNRGERGDVLTVTTIYHLARLGSYAVLGGIAGAVGRMPLLWLSTSALRWLPWFLVVFFVALALRWDRHFPRMPGLARFSLHLHIWTRRLSRNQAAGALGAATPLLPCGPLYFVLSLGLLSGSWLRGIELMLAFGLGTVPLLWVTQLNFNWVRRSISQVWLGRLRTGFCLAIALIIGWRLRATLGFAGPNPLNFVCF